MKADLSATLVVILQPGGARRRSRYLLRKPTSASRRPGRPVSLVQDNYLRSSPWYLQPALPDPAWAAQGKSGGYLGEVFDVAAIVAARLTSAIGRRNRLSARTSAR